MTKEEKLICKMYLDDLDKTHDCNEYKLLMELLEQQPNDNCVSRQAVIEYIKASDAELGHNCENELVVEDILNMPPVTPTFPKGATNGDILKIVFPNIKWKEIHDFKGNKSIGCTNEFWNAPYKRGDLDDSN